jgi:hypothetical protein
MLEKLNMPRPERDSNRGGGRYRDQTSDDLGAELGDAIAVLGGDCYHGFQRGRRCVLIALRDALGILSPS